ncbi:hypothetical protein [Roseibium sediminicola]|uniref:DUF7847 domain-containing protein n=1 Tax=Roseibium sediminicola TaxID=2933272 RepID=A0ABT0GSA5_9HYPH|nr:hypothetical protein [Roseibium sp. CAU 1639]MCK7612319.1 hypothetical protein [Roseibium sp. CAU 1639]
MTETADNPPRIPLGIGVLIGESFSILFRNFLPVVLISFVPTLIGLLVSGSLVGFEAVIGFEDTVATDAAPPGMQLLTSLVDTVVYSVTTAFLVQLAYDAKLKRPMRFGRYIGPALRAIVPIMILSFAVGLMVGIAAIALIIPGLWVYAVFSVMEPAVVIEGVGFGGLGRSAELTREYRWPILGALIPIFVYMALIFAVAFFLVSLIGLSNGLALPVLLFAAISAIGSSLVSIFISLLYARLREIKEGVGVDQIAAVFD